MKLTINLLKVAYHPVSCYITTFGQMESVNVVDVLQEAEEADSRACTRSQVQVNYFIILYTSTFIRLSHLFQEAHVHFNGITNNVGMG